MASTACGCQACASRLTRHSPLSFLWLTARDLIATRYRSASAASSPAGRVGSDRSRRFLSSANIPLDSLIYPYLDKLAGYGLINSDFKGIRPLTKAEAARLVIEASRNIAAQDPAAVPPFALELLARIRAVLRRARPGEKSLTAAWMLTAGNLSLDRRARRVTLGGKAVDMTPKALSVLEYLILPASAFWTYVIWGESLSGQAILGMALIVAAGTVIALRARAQER